MYWLLLLEHLKTLYRQYVWQFREPTTNVVDDNSSFPTCAFFGCVRKPMALTSFCNFHILSDPRQLIYKPCEYVFRKARDGIITCGRPILRSNVTSLCNVHMQEANKHLSMALKEAGANVSSTGGEYTPPQFHVLVAEFVRQIQAKRRELRGNRSRIVSETKMITEQ